MCRQAAASTTCNTSAWQTRLCTTHASTPSTQPHSQPTACTMPTATQTHTLKELGYQRGAVVTQLAGKRRGVGRFKKM